MAVVTRSDRNGQRQLQTVHVAITKEKLKVIRAMAELAHRSLNAQVAWLVDDALGRMFPSKHGGNHVG